MLRQVNEFLEKFAVLHYPKVYCIEFGIFTFEVFIGL